MKQISPTQMLSYKHNSSIGQTDYFLNAYTVIESIKWITIDYIEEPLLDIWTEIDL